MKIVSFQSLSQNKKKKRCVIYCTKPLFKPLVFTMGVFIVMLVTNLFVSNFFANIGASLQNFVDNFANEIGELLIGYSIYADRTTSPGHYVLFIEPTGEHSKEEETLLAEKFEKSLCNGNVSVAPLIASGALGHCEVKLLKKGTYDDYRQILKDGGANLNQVKPIKVIDTDKKKDFFFNHTI